MCNAWNHHPGCNCGWGGEGHSGAAPQGRPPTMHQLGFFDATAAPTWQYQDRFAVASKCPKCQKPVYFIRHKGGSVWVDELGWPWPKHGCFTAVKDPPWLQYAAERTAQQRQISSPAVSVTSIDSVRSFVGIVVSALMWRIVTKPVIVLFLNGGEAIGRAVAIIEGGNATDLHMGCLGVVSPDQKSIVLTNFETKELIGYAQFTENDAGLSAMRSALLTASNFLRS